MKRRIARASAVLAGAAAVILAGSASPAMAADITLTGYWGTMKFIDDGDVFQVCDTYADGQGVKGYIKYQPILGTAGIIETIDDGGDAGCDKKGVNIGNDGDYQMIFCSQNGIGECKSSGWFNE
jgi:hypothetical protein